MKKGKPIFFLSVALLILVLVLIYVLFKFAEEKRENEKLHTFLNIYHWLEQDLGIGTLSLTLTSGEGQFSRGGYYSGEGTDPYNNIVRIYHTHGWCSSGGQECGFSVCFSAPIPEISEEANALFETKLPTENFVYKTMKNNLCNSNIFNNINFTEKCLSEEYEKSISGRMIFSINFTDEGNLVKGTKTC